jgi:hypothetical protein
MNTKAKIAALIKRYPEKHFSTNLHGLFGGFISRTMQESPEKQAEFLLSFLKDEKALKFAEGLVPIEPMLKPPGGYGLATVTAALAEVMEKVPETAVINKWTKTERAAAYDWAIREKSWQNDQRYNRRPKPAFIRMKK